jgi:hypothetical protein
MKKSFLTGIAMIALVIFPSQVFAADTTTLQTQLMTYLPYILIGGAVILLISIIGILLSKKKEKEEETVMSSAVPVVENTVPEVATPETETPAQPVNMDNISSNLYAPAEAKPTIQETMESGTPSEESPIAQPEFTPSVPPVTEQTQSSDLQAILQGEASAAPMGPVTDNVTEAIPAPESSTPSFVANPMSEVPAEAPEPSMDDQLATPVTEAPATQMFNPSAPEVTPAVPDFQQFINNQAAEVPTAMDTNPAMGTPAPMAAAPTQDFNSPMPTADTSATANSTQAGAPFSI